MNANWTRESDAQLDAIYDYIAQESPFHAQQTVERLYEKTQQIKLFPMSGRIVPNDQNASIREVICGSYRILYRIDPDQIEIISVMHTAREFPPHD